MIDASLAGLNRVGLAAPGLELDFFLERASADTGLSDFGSDEFREGLEVLLEDLESETVRPLGRALVAKNIDRLLRNRLHLVDSVKTEAEVYEQDIRRPLFIAGLPRSGTTILQRMLSQDPSLRLLRTWEIDHPFPRARRRDFHDNSRLRRSRRELRFLDRAAPGFKRIHELGAKLPEECIGLMAVSFRSVIFNIPLSAPRYREWLAASDLRPAYAIHRQLLQHLKSDFEFRHYALKAPMHLGRLRELLEVYPDALIVQTHRRLDKVVPSLASLFFTMRSAFEKDVDPARIGESSTEDLHGWLQAAVEVRKAAQAGEFSDARFFDCYYEDLIADPVAQLQRIYDCFGLPWSPGLAQRMRAFVAVNRQHKFGKHVYRPEDFGLSEAELETRFRDYYEFFGKSDR
jgi:hypothetical protein